MPAGDREQWPLDGTLHPDTLTRVASPLLQTADFHFRMSLLRAPTEIFCPLLVPLSPCPWYRLRSRPHANEGTGSSGRLMELCTLTPSRVRLHLFCRQPTSPFRMSLIGPPQRSSARFSFHCLRVLGIASDHGRSGDTPQENTDSSATRLGPHANEGTGSSGRLMELCTLTPSRVRLHLFCRQPSRSGDTPQENTDSSATRLGPHANEGTGSSGRLMELCTLTPSRVRFTSSADSRVSGPRSRVEALFTE
ncbi:Clip-Associating Protein 1 [Manis pentadactyla]|nr:Clip-Associating Protein 1 [Manis pentadactyla]